MQLTLINIGAILIKNNSDAKRLKSFYKTYDDIKNNKYDAMIITGAPIETLAYEKIKYWEELKTIFEFDKLKEIIGDGAQVYQEDAINPVAKKNITIKILNTNDPENHGTIIIEEKLRPRLTHLGLNFSSIIL